MASGIKQFNIMAWLFSGLLLAAPLCTAPFADDAQATEQQLKQLKNSIQKLEHWLKDAKGQRTRLSEELKQSELEIGRISKKIFSVTREIKKTQSKLHELSVEHKQLNQARAQQEQQLANQIRAAYRIGRQEYVKVLLNQEQPEQLARALRYYDYFNRARTEQINNYNQLIDRIQQNETATHEQKLALDRSKEQLELKNKTLTNSKTRRQQVLLKLESSIKNNDQQLQTMVADRKNLERLLNEVEKTIAELELPDNAAPIKQLKGKLPWPTSGRIVRRFGRIDPISHTRWNGIIIDAVEGDEVKAIHRGRVVFADWLRGFGLLVILDHGNGYMSLYGHNQTLYKDLGDWVDPNEVIARVGSSGGRSNSGLYFEIRHQGRPQNPQRWMLAKR